MIKYQVKDTVDVAEETKTEITCAHHWIIEPATGVTSAGACKLCGARKEFSNQFKRASLISPDFTSLSTASPKVSTASPKDGEGKESPAPVTENPSELARVP